MKQFEYKVINYRPDVTELNELGKEGWELCTIRDRDEYTSSYRVTTCELVFKREID